jgi:Ca2+-binding RTX toxin-like protein
MKRIALMAIAVLVTGCSTQPPVIVKSSNDYEHPVIRKPLTEVGTSGNDDLVAPFSRFQQDTVYGLNGRDWIDGHIGDDDLYGGDGNDHIYGDEDADYIVGGQGWDFLSGGRHADIIEAADGEQDTVLCGNGEGDRVSVDKEDTVDGCETVNGKPAK